RPRADPRRRGAAREVPGTWVNIPGCRRLAGRAPHHPGTAPARRMQAMPMRYAYSAIADADVPRASFPLAQHLLDTYASESNKVVSVWREFSDADLEYRDRKSTRLNSSHVKISYAVFCL